MDGSRSPDGDQHPGTITHEDRVKGREWTTEAADVPQGIAWVELDGTWHPVLRIEITGVPGRRRITQYGKDDAFLMATVEAPPP